MTRDELKARFPNASEAFLRNNASVGGLEDHGAKSVEVRPLVKSEQERARCKEGMGLRVTLIALRRRLLDDDAVEFSCKPVRDIIAWTILGGSFGQFDNDKRIQWEYAQQKTSGREGVIVKIECMCNA